ncbi:hypothetical protein X907_0584 [Glycocaulis alkaliphilus]|uniref:Uncharacterized protein n=1 Tax=Glycocaulis alkaliphilus TaxID=1434191 RepID=A0A3T0E6V8_9PROT|nr:hypothetical protein [Glycocaulis alkaliphilus]AZU03131.1 hypothetical protein X907_0584 [Glycocaulis alkaliphilus]GGB71245.1 hypothetical protein GCM10007417_08790 [Glycocaulis alkaliphilus]
MTRKPWFASMAFLLLALTACADRQSIAAHQMPMPYPARVAEADPSSSFYRQTALGAVTGTSQFSWFLPEPNRTVFRARFERMLEQTRLAAPRRDHARFVVNFDFDHVDGPVFGSHMDAMMVGRMRVVDRMTGQTVMDEPVSARREAYWPGVMEHHWADGRVWDIFTILPFFFDSPWLAVGPRVDTVYPAFSGPEWFPLIPIGMRDTGALHVRGEDGRVYGARSGADRAWQVNAAVSDALAAAFLLHLEQHGQVSIARVLPCGGGAEIRRLQIELMGRGERFVSMPCTTPPTNLPIGAEALARQ